MEVHNAKDLLDFIYKSPTAFHVVNNVEKILLSQGFTELKEYEKWHLQREGKYFIKKNNSAFIAFVIGKEKISDNGFKIIGAHTDFPCFKVKPYGEVLDKDKYLRLNTEVYGGPILNTWMDRPLSIAGRITLKGDNLLEPKEKFININKPLFIIPNLAIHMNKSVNKGIELNPQKDILPLMTVEGEDLREGILEEIIKKELNLDNEKIISYELSLYEFDKGTLMGLNNEFISSSRLDNLAMVHAGLKAILNSKVSKATNVLVCFDNEEVGSSTKQGADSPLLSNILERIVEKEEKGREAYFRALSRSFLISADLAHAVHPSSPEKADPINKPMINKGPVIKVSERQSYTSDAISSAIYKQICEKANVPYQIFTNRSDERGGSTIGPISSTHLNINSVDIGSPILAMHSIREFGGVKDHYYITKSFEEFYNL
ncbi:M18 family aminopeptidase [Clostridium cochlearium]|uniref:M18 family aminopeptidase n=1 Tax=Clostridium cochlearium TaxID=1494 RepID=A0A1G9FM51_CLOCO|nr:M18 family aminopeptidase [Clostridium cochlearium]MBV1816739.1 M18 family aminopeptidase [Bacteroidales bacterium MSK.15.36]NSJ90392.1 M18 family aminopeptidase [Coprococcus sp. MSK.21.13]MBE6065178.1 M18 family aminopeptidase [Clostridium cochlearium]MCG4570988.1 M18 family aminopeptidase [Clostridium cochlearium]MDU1442588.1 M18 family aminopeptidase [Clostridium cochlearium]